MWYDMMSFLNLSAIRVATKWYSAHVGSNKVFLLTNDAANRELALKEGLHAETSMIHTHSSSHLVHTYVESSSNQYPEWLDLLVDLSAMHDDEDKKISFTEYINNTEVIAGIKLGKYFQGPLRMNRNNFQEGYVQGEGELHKCRATNAHQVILMTYS